MNVLSWILFFYVCNMPDWDYIVAPPQHKLATTPRAEYSKHYNTKHIDSIVMQSIFSIVMQSMTDRAAPEPRPDSL